MKKLLIILLTLAWSITTEAQQYKTDFGNDASYHIEMSLSAYKVLIKSTTNSEVRIERKELDPETCCDDYKHSERFHEMRELEQERKALEQERRAMMQERQQLNPNSNEEMKDRKAGLNPLSPKQVDNSGVGLIIDKSGKTLSIAKQSNTSSFAEYTIYVPDKVSITYNDVFPEVQSHISFEDHKGEIVITSINSNLSFEEVSGPIVANNTNGNVEIVFENIAPNKPNSISAVNGFVDITLDSKVKADIKLNTINGEAYTDFDIDVKSSKPVAAMPAPMDMVNIEGSINGGGQLITVSSVMGDIYLRKQK